jgi:hypothetical protein
MSREAAWRILQAMSRFLLHHRHEPSECPAAFAAWSGFASPLRRRAAIGSCHFGDHEIWWEVEAATADEALGHLPWYLAIRTRAIRIREVAIP